MSDFFGNSCSWQGKCDSHHSCGMVQCLRHCLNVLADLPLEILPLGGYEPIYRSALDVPSGELPVLPLSIYGAVAMSHPPGDSEGLAATESFFLYKFDRSASGLAGLAFDEGTFGVFGYVTQGAELLQQLDNGDVIKQMTLISGGDRLQMPQGSSDAP